MQHFIEASTVCIVAISHCILSRKGFIHVDTTRDSELLQLECRIRHLIRPRGLHSVYRESFRHDT